MVWYSLYFLRFFSRKINAFVEGRKDLFKDLQNTLQDTDRIAWFHAASLGEFEQGLPVIIAFRKQFEGYKVLLTFFSPSGYDVVRHRTDVADIITYLPFDTPMFVKRFLHIVKPRIAFFIKYEFWPNYLYYLRKHQTETFLISAIFRPNQLFFKSQGRFARIWLNTFSHIFVQDENSEKLLVKINYSNVTISGDTRFDRVSENLSFSKKLDVFEKFKGNARCVIILGSTYPEDEDLFMEHLKSVPLGVKYIVVPHNINKVHIKSLEKRISKNVQIFSELDPTKTSYSDILIVDVVGFLSRLYSYAEIAYIGGGIKKRGLHNILEAAVFGIPVLIGPCYTKFKEASDLVALKGVSSVSSQEEALSVINMLLMDDVLRKKQGEICSNYVHANTGATKRIIEVLKNRNA